MLFIGGHPLGKPNVQQTPSLKRHTAWEYPESAAHHKCLFGSRTPTHHVAQPDKKSISVSKNQLFLTRPFLLGQNRQVKKGGIVGTPPSETRGTHCHPGHLHPDLLIKHTWHAFPNYLKEDQTALISISAGRFTQCIRMSNIGRPDTMVRTTD